MRHIGGNGTNFLETYCSNIRGSRFEGFRRRCWELTQGQRFDLEAEVIRSVCRKEKIVKSSWIAGNVPVLKKKDCVALALAPQSGPSDANILRDQLAEVNQRLATTERELWETRQQAATERLIEEERWQASNTKFDELTESLRGTFPTTFNMGRTTDGSSDSASRH